MEAKQLTEQLKTCEEQLFHAQTEAKSSTFKLAIQDQKLVRVQENYKIVMRRLESMASRSKELKTDNLFSVVHFP